MRREQTNLESDLFDGRVHQQDDHDGQHWRHIQCKLVLHQTGVLLPVIRKDGDELLVGVMSGGRARLPVGTVQLLVDRHEA
jgi:hypothetical protein